MSISVVISPSPLDSCTPFLTLPLPSSSSSSSSSSLSVSTSNFEMLTTANNVGWMEPSSRLGEDEEADNNVASWSATRRAHEPDPPRHEDDINMNGSLSSFKSILENDWYTTPPPPAEQPPCHHHYIIPNPNPHDFRDIMAENVLLQATMHSSSSCFLSPAFAVDTSESHQPFSAPKYSLSSLPNVVCANPFDNCSLNYVYDPQFLGQIQSSDISNSVLMNFGTMNAEIETGGQRPGSNSEFPALGTVFSSVGLEGFEDSSSPRFVSRSKVLWPLELVPTTGAEPSLFQKRVMTAAERMESSGFSGDGNLGKGGMGCQLGKRGRVSEEDEVGEGSFDVLAFDYDSNEADEIDKYVKNDRKNENFSVSSGLMAGGDQKGKKKGMPAKNLMAERRRRKKLNDRLHMLRSVVPKISKMDRASILGDAIEYLKELVQRIRDLHNELESAHPGSSNKPHGFDPLTPSQPTLPSRIREELYPNSMSSPKSQPARVEVQAREGRAINIHMFCARRPGLLLSIVRALDNLGLDIQQAVISCFNGFALDVFRAEQCREDLDILPEQIKAVLLDSTGFHGVI
ncbi:hypothetical protein Ancab_026423 [Ancistrocladus abbreviatus]